MEISGKAAIVTGGGTGVGRATALALARGGCNVLVNYSESQEEAEATVAEAESHGVSAIAVQGDVSQDEDCRRLVDAAVDSFGGLDILVNNAGTTRFVPANELEEITDRDWRRIFAVNVQGPFQMARAARAALLTADSAEIVNVTSVAAFSGAGSSIPYAASKAALNNLTVALARVMAPTIRVNAVAPGFIAGRWLKKGLGNAYEPMKAAFEQANPLKKVCQPADVAAAILAIITGSDLVTGQVLVCDGGMSIGSGGLSIPGR